MSTAVRRLVIWGASGHARVLREAIGPDGPRLVAVFDRDEVDPPFTDVPMFTGGDALDRWLTQDTGEGDVGFVAAIGGARGADRIEVHERLSSCGLSPVTVVHRRAFVADGASCGPGAQVLALAGLCEGASIGVQTIINTGATVDHESALGDGVHVGPGARLAGLVTVEDQVFIGTGAVVLPRVHIGFGATIGAGAVVRHDVAPYATMVGNPARKVEP